MSTFTVHVPPGLADEAERAERTVFVREGFDWPAFLLGPFALLWRGLWRAALVWMAALLVLSALVVSLGIDGLPAVLLYLLLAAFTGLEAAEARRRALGRSGFIPAALVCGVTREAGERLFFGSAAPLSQPLAPRPGPATRRPSGQPRVIGLFPSPGGRA